MNKKMRKIALDNWLDEVDFILDARNDQGIKFVQPDYTMIRMVSLLRQHKMNNKNTGVAISILSIWLHEIAAGIVNDPITQ